MKADDIVWVASFEDGHDHNTETLGVYVSEALARAAVKRDIECRYKYVPNAQPSTPKGDMDTRIYIYFGCGHSDKYSWNEFVIQWSLDD